MELLEHLGNFAYFLGFDFGSWKAAVISCAVLKILPFLQTYFFQTREEISGFLWNIPDDSTQATKLTHRQRMNSSTQAKLEQQV